MFRRGGGGIGGGAGRGTFNPPSFLNEVDGSSAKTVPGVMGRAGRSQGVASASPMRRGKRDQPDVVQGDDSAEEHSDYKEEKKKSRLLGLSNASTLRCAPPAQFSDGSLSRPTSASSTTSGPMHMTASSPSRDGSGADEYYMCMWRKPQARKHKTWDGDAVLIVSRTRGNCKLKCQESGHELGFSAKLFNDEFESGEELTIGGKEVKIDRQITHREYLSGIPSSLQWPASKKTLTQQTSSRASPASPISVNTSRSRLMAPAPATSFYGTALRKPKSPLQASAQRRISPEVLKGFVENHEDESDSETGLSGPSFREKAKRKATSSSASRGGGVSATRLSRPHVICHHRDKAEPRYDPNALNAVVMNRPNEEHQRQYNRRGDALVDVVVNPWLSGKLRPHQVEGVKFLYDRVMGIRDVNGGRGAILADEMGLGKTLQTIALVETLLRQSPYYSSSSPRAIEKALIVCPLTLVKNWQREFRKWLGQNGSSNIGVVAVDGTKGREVAQHFVISKRDSVLIIGYEKLRSCIDVLSMAQPPVGLIVCDEGHRLKSKDAKTTRMFNQLSTDRRVILTGTPIQNDLSELYAMIDFVCPSLLGSYAAFRQIFEDPILKSRMQSCSPDIKRLGQERSGVLSEVTKLVVLRRTATILDGYLRPKSESVLFCAPSSLQLELYRRILKSSQVRALMTDGSSGAGAALPLITLLRQVCDSPELLLKDADSRGSSKGKKVQDSLADEVLRDGLDLFPSKRTHGDVTLSGKLEALSRILAAIKAKTDDKVVVVSTFTAMLDVLESMCRRLRYPFVRLDGKTKQDDRQCLVNRFNSKARSDSFVFLLSTRAGGVGLNLVGANRLFLMEPEWNPALDQQAMARIHRDGQAKRCYIYRMMMSGTMDEKIFQRQIQKLGLSDTLMGGGGDGSEGDGARPSKSKKRRQAGGDAAAGSSSNNDTFTPEELKDIFTLHEDTPCLCHDLLMCGCGGVGREADAIALTDSEEEAEEAEADGEKQMVMHFIPASQQQAQWERQRVKNFKARLAGLADWRHLDTRVSGESAPFAVRVACVAEQDGVLASVVEGQRGRLRPGRRGQEAGSRPSPERPLLEQTDLECLEAAIAADQSRSSEGGWRVEDEKAGNVLYVLQRQSGKVVTKGCEGCVAGESDGSDSCNDGDVLL